MPKEVRRLWPSAHLRELCRGDAVVERTVLHKFIVRSLPDYLSVVKDDDAIRIHVRNVYGKCGQNLTRAAEALGVSRNTARKYL